MDWLSLLMFPLLLIVPAFVAVTESSPDWVSILLNGGPFAIVVALILMDKLTPTGERDRLRNENDELRAEVKQLNISIREEVVPPLVRLNSLIADVVEELSDKKYYEHEKS